MNNNYYPLYIILLILTFSSCSSDNEVPKSVKMNIRGDYHGVVGCVCKEQPLDTIKFDGKTSINSSKINFSAFPVACIVDSVFGCNTAREQNLMTVPLTLSYDLHPTPFPNSYAVSYSPSKISLEVESKGVKHKLRIDLYGINSGVPFWYNNGNDRFEANLRTSGVYLDGKSVTRFASYPDSVRKVDFRFFYRIDK